jgi:hypothetical protein
MTAAILSNTAMNTSHFASNPTNPIPHLTPTVYVKWSETVFGLIIGFAAHLQPRMISNYITLQRLCLHSRSLAMTVCWIPNSGFQQTGRNILSPLPARIRLSFLMKFLNTHTSCLFNSRKNAALPHSLSSHPGTGRGNLYKSEGSLYSNNLNCPRPYTFLVRNILPRNTASLIIFRELFPIPVACNGFETQISPFTQTAMLQLKSKVNLTSL